MYTPLNDKVEDSSQEPEDYEALLTSSTAKRRDSTHRKRFWCTVFFGPVVSIGLVALGIWIGSRLYSNPDEICPRHVQHYSPVLKEVDTSIHTVTFNGSLFKQNDFRKDAGPEVDAAWESLGVGFRSIALPESEAAESGFRADQVKINEKYGGGYPANIEGLHHLHCLNLVRQSLYYNYDYYHEQGHGAFKNEDNVVKAHVSHCLDIIRQQLMCQPDTGLLGQVWWNPNRPTAFVDFNTPHKCKNFDAIRQWAEERQISKTVAQDFLQPPKAGDLVYDSIP